MNGPRAARVYRALLRLYPRGFRDEYGPDMVLLFAHQLRDEAAARVWARGVVDLTLTLPALHLESRMKHPSNTATPVAFASLSLAGLLVAVVGGSSLGMLAVGLSVALAAGALAVLAWRNSRTVTTAPPATAQWWKFLIGGAGVLTAIGIATTISGEVANRLWWPMMITISFALTILAAGLILGVAHLTRNRTHRAAG